MNKKKLIGWILVLPLVIAIFAALYMVGGFETVLIYIAVIASSAMFVKGLILLLEEYDNS